MIAADGAVVSHVNFSNLLLDIAVLRSLHIHVVLVHGAAEQISQSAKEQSLTPSDTNGTGITDNTAWSVTSGHVADIRNNGCCGLHRPGFEGVVV